MLTLFVGFGEDFKELLPDSDRFTLMADPLLRLWRPISRHVQSGIRSRTSGVLESFGSRVNIFLTQKLAAKPVSLMLTDMANEARLEISRNRIVAAHCVGESNNAHRNCADSTAVVFLSIRTALMFLARLACMSALSCFFDESPST
jgi:hypothetical protein